MSNDPSGGIPCPKCGGQSSSVLDSRTLAASPETRRRRQCACGERFTTYERIAVAEKPNAIPRAEAPRASVYRRKHANGEAFYVAQVREADGARTYIGSYPNPEKAREACAKYIETGERPKGRKRGMQRGHRKQPGSRTRWGTPVGARSAESAREPVASTRPSCNADRLEMIARIARRLE